MTNVKWVTKEEAREIWPSKPTHMSKVEIITILQENNIFPDGIWYTYEKAKKLVCEDAWDDKEYERRIKIVSKYVGV